MNLSITESELSINKYSLKWGESKEDCKFSFESTKFNIYKILKGLLLGKPILLEGPPGVGKTSSIEQLSKAIGKKLIRVNLSE